MTWASTVSLVVLENFVHFIKIHFINVLPPIPEKKPQNPPKTPKKPPKKTPQALAAIFFLFSLLHASSEMTGLGLT